MVHLTSVPFDIQPTFPDSLLNGEHPSSLSVRLHRTLFIVASDPFSRRETAFSEWFQYFPAVSRDKYLWICD